MPLRVLLCFLLFASCQAIASPVDPGRLKVLSEAPLWLALLHVNRGATIHSRGESYVDDDNFFLHPDGATDALAELEKTVELTRVPGAEARCRFPARYRYLAEQLDWPLEGAFSHCGEYQEWFAQIPRQRLVLVFPASYLNSPSSMFGHTLLRLDGSDDPETVWPSWAVNFGAAVSGQENSILYVYRGLAGGYPGRFVIVPYATKIQEYSHMENRDMWEYTLDLEPEEIELLVMHLWELREVNFDYYFFDENCSFRLLELLDIIRPGTSLLDGFRLAEPPVNTVRALYEADLIEERVYRPSKAVELEADRLRLDKHAQRLSKRLMKDPTLAQSEAFLAYSESDRHLMARLAFRTLRFEYRKKERDADVAQRSFALLRVMNAYQYDGDDQIAAPVPPEMGHGTQMLSLGGGQLDNTDFGDIGYRFTYHDLIDRNTGFLRGAQIEGIDLRFRSTDSEALKLQTADIVHIRSLSPRNRMIKPISWFVHGGLERAQAGERKRLVRFVQGGPGLTWQAGGFMPYAFAVARVENNSAYSPLLEGGGGASAGALWYLPWAEINLGGEGIYFGNDEYRHRQFFHVNIPLGRQDALRAEWQRDAWRGDNENGFSISWRHFFD